MATKNELDSDYPIEILAGGTGRASFSVPYSVICGGTSTTNPLQVIASLGSSGQVLENQGPSLLPQWANFTPSANAGLVLIESQQGAGGDIEFTTGITTTYQNFMIVFTNVITSGTSFQFSLNGGSSYVNTGYFVDNHWRAFNATTYNTNSASNTTALGMGSIDSGFPVNGVFTLYRGFAGASPFDPAMTGMFTGLQSGGTDLTLTQFMGYHNGNIDPINAIKVSNITSGTVSVYGWIFS
jgi:hypothetical protein